MIPINYDITIWRGITFELELVTQVKVYNYDPAVNISVADGKRTYAENLVHYGFKYEYLDFSTDYVDAELKVIKPWIKSGQSSSTPLLVLDNTGDQIQLTDKSVKILMAADETAALEFDSGIYELRLTRSTTGEIDGLVHGKVTVLGEGLVV